MRPHSGQIKAPGSRTDGDVLEAIHDRLGRGRSPRQIYGELSADTRFGARTPSIKTIKRMADTFGPPSSEDRWSLEAADPEQVVAVWPVFAAFAKRDKVWQCAYVTKAVAHVLVRLFAGAPDLDPYVAYLVAAAFVARQRDGRPTLGLELGLAFAPWRDEAAANALARVRAAGFVDTELDRDVGFVEHQSRLAQVDPIAEAEAIRIEAVEESMRDAAEGWWASLSPEEQQAEVELSGDRDEALDYVGTEWWG